MYMIMKHNVSSSFIDATECGQLTAPGYKVTTTTYTGTTESVLCDDGYAGTPDPAETTCSIDGEWDIKAFTGCSTTSMQLIYSFCSLD